MRFLLLLLFSIQAYSETINLTVDNSYTLSGYITEESVDQAIEALKSTKVKYFVLTSPGGEMFAGNKLAAYVATRKDLSCIGNYALSAAFTTLQSCPTRLVIKSSVLMQHEASTDLPRLSISEIKKIVEEGIKLDEQRLKPEAARLKMSYSEYRARIEAMFWLYSGQQAIYYRAADKLVEVKCQKELYEDQRIIEQGNPKGKTIIADSRCPLIKK